MGRTLQHATRRQREKQEDGKRIRLTQREIVEKATELFARDGFGATSLDDIADALGVSQAALYYHVKNKEEILRHIYLSVLNASEEPLRRIATSDQPPREKLRHAIEHQVMIAADRSPAMTVFYREWSHLTGPFAHEIKIRQKSYERYFEQIIREGQAAGQFAPNCDPKIATFGLLGMCNWLSHWYHESGRLTPRQIADTFEYLIGSGLDVLPERYDSTTPLQEEKAKQS